MRDIVIPDQTGINLSGQMFLQQTMVTEKHFKSLVFEKGTKWFQGEDVVTDGQKEICV